MGILRADRMSEATKGVNDSPKVEHEDGIEGLMGLSNSIYIGRHGQARVRRMGDSNLASGDQQMVFWRDVRT